MKYDVIVIGGGPSGMFFAYEMKQKCPEKKILIIERGHKLKERYCPAEKLGRCIKCELCHITNGSSGSGAYSDGKLSLFNEDDKTFYVGGRLHEYCGVEETKKLIEYTDNVYLKFGATKEIKGGKTSDFAHNLSVEAEEAGLNLVAIPIRHLGTDWAHEVYAKLEKYLKEHNVDTFFKSEVRDLIIKDNKISGVKYFTEGKLKKVYAETVVLAVGRAGADWLEKMCNQKNIKSIAAPIDIGVRYELSDGIMQEVNENLYEAKIIGYPDPYNDKVRTFCQNPSGFVTSEAYKGGLTLVNGHSTKETKSCNTNISLLVSLELKNEKKPTKFCRNICKNLNRAGGGQVIVQRFGDLVNGKPTTDDDLFENSVKSTLNSAVPGDLGVGMPYRVIKDIISFIYSTDKIIPGFANEDNLLYGPEAKFYSNRLDLTSNFETSVKGLYAIGDGCGLTRGLMMASASGVQLARNLLN